ncbi:MAG TPA: DUF433 domain-containing protein [Cyclobacteriaceae bacterium]|nr:DUF433 domain-containing protein [Cyclobacteriaceae bacterium]
MKAFSYIVAKADTLGEKPIINGTRISVEMILEWLASGATVDEIATKYSHLSKEAVYGTILYASQAMRNEIVIEAS